MIRELIDTDLEAVAGGTPSAIVPIAANFNSTDQYTTITQTANSYFGPAVNVIGSAGNSNYSSQGAVAF